MRLFAAALLAVAAPCFAQEPASAAPVSVWARALFGEDGKLRELTLLDEDRYPKAFAESVKARIGGAKIKPPVVDGKPATLRTGMELRFASVSTPEGPATKIVGMSMSPLPLRREFDLAQADRPSAWTGELSASCVVNVEGECGPVELMAAPNTPETLRRYVKSTLERLRFEPQQVGGKPVEGEYVHRVVVTSEVAAPPDFRDARRIR